MSTPTSRSACSISTPTRVVVGTSRAMATIATPRVCDTLKSMRAPASASSGRPRTPRRIATSAGAHAERASQHVAQSRRVPPSSGGAAHPCRSAAARAALRRGKRGFDDGQLLGRALELAPPQRDTGHRGRKLLRHVGHVYLAATVEVITPGPDRRGNRAVSPAPGPLRHEARFPHLYAGSRGNGREVPGAGAHRPGAAPRPVYHVDARVGSPRALRELTRPAILSRASRSPSNPAVSCYNSLRISRRNGLGTAHFFLAQPFWHGDEPRRTPGAHTAPDGVRAGRLGELSQGPVRARLHRQAERRQRRGLRARLPPAHPAVRGRERRLRSAGGVVAGSGSAAAKGGGLSALHGRGSRVQACQPRGATSVA